MSVISKNIKGYRLKDVSQNKLLEVDVVILGVIIGVGSEVVPDLGVDIVKKMASASDVGIYNLI